MPESSEACSASWLECVSKLPMPQKKICRCTPSAARTWMICAICCNWAPRPFAGKVVLRGVTDFVAAVRTEA